MVTLAISIGISVAFIPLNNLWAAINAVNPIAGWAMGGLFHLPLVFLVYVIRRPGTALLFSVVSGLTWALASPYGLFGMIASLIEGLLSEAALFLATRYRVYTVRTMVVSSLIFTVFAILVAGILFGGLMLEPVIAVSAAAVGLISYVIAGALGPVLAEQVAKTGVLNGTALGQQRQVEV